MINRRAFFKRAAPAIASVAVAPAAFALAFSRERKASVDEPGQHSGSCDVSRFDVYDSHGVLLDRSVFKPIYMIAGDTLQVTYTLKVV